MIRFQDSNKRFISETTHTVIVNEHGALLLLAASVKVDQILRIENPNLGEELLCRVTSLGPSFMGKTQVAVELIMPTAGFWGTGSNTKTPNLGQQSQGEIAGALRTRSALFVASRLTENGINLHFL